MHKLRVDLIRQEETEDAICADVTQTTSVFTKIKTAREINILDEISRVNDILNGISFARVIQSKSYHQSISNKKFYNFISLFSICTLYLILLLR